MSDMYFDIPLRLPNTEYKYGDLVAANEVYPTPYEVALADIRLSLADLCAFVDFGAGGTLTPFLASKIEITAVTPVSAYPPTQSDTYVKATTTYGTAYCAYYASDPTKSLTGLAPDNAYVSQNTHNVNQRYHIDLGSSKILSRIYYENYHHVGTYADIGVKNFTLWGSNDASAFNDLTYDHDMGWTQISDLSQNHFDRHISSDQVDPKYITINNLSASYRYIAFKFADNYGESAIGFRRIELQTNPKITGYSKALGTGEAFGSELITGWVSSALPYYTLTLDGPTILSAINLGGTAANYSMNFILDTGKTYRIVINLTINSGQAPSCDTALASGIAVKAFGALNPGHNTFEFIAETGEIYLELSNTSASNYSATASLKQALSPSETGVTIVSTPGGSIQSWESIETGFNRDPAGYICQIYRSGHIYMCSTPGISGATPPDFNRSPGSLSTDGAVVWTQCTPAGMRYRASCTFDANPRYGDYRRVKKYFQPMDRADGGDLYVYDKGLDAEHSRSISWEKILPRDLTHLLEFIEMVRGAAYPFNFYDENGDVHQVRITNPDTIKSAPVSFNFEGGITVELLYINEPKATETDEEYYADGTCWADGTIYAG